MNYKDTSTECAICLEPLFNDENNHNNIQEHQQDYDNDDDKEEGSSNANTNTNDVIELICGHKWHYSCIKHQLEHSNPYNQSKTQRIIFTGCRCAKCGIYCNHPSLQNITRYTNQLRQQIDTMILEQIKLEEKDQEQEEKVAQQEQLQTITSTTTILTKQQQEQQREQLLEEGRRKYAFYLCKSCNEPYFGGTIECADDELLGDEQQQQQLSNNAGGTAGGGSGSGASDHFCVACAPQLQSIRCHNPIQHRASHVWKCRYCCQVATMVCYGNVHFCQSCHDRNTHRVNDIQQQQQKQQLGRNRRSGHVTIPSLDAIPCQGEDKCPYPKPKRKRNDNANNYDPLSYPNPQHYEYHKNGPTSDCEQVYYCAACQSTSTSSSSQQQQQQQQEPNLILNPNGNDGLVGWRQWNTQLSWTVEDTQSDLPLCTPDISTNFVSSFTWCIMSQQVDLEPHLVQCSSRGTTTTATTTATTATIGTAAADGIAPPTPTPSLLRFQVAASFLGRTDCPSVYCLEALVVGQAKNESESRRGQQQQQQQQVLQRHSTGIRSTPCDAWEQVSLIVDIDTSTIQYNNNNNTTTTTTTTGLPPSNNDNQHNIKPQLVVVIRGKDSKFWQGRFGSKVTNISVRKISSDSDNNGDLHPPTATATATAGNTRNDELLPLRVGGGRGRSGIQRTGMIRNRNGNIIQNHHPHDNNNVMPLPTQQLLQRHLQQHQPQPSRGAGQNEEPSPRGGVIKSLVIEGILPILCLLFFAWWSSSTTSS